MAYSTFPSYAQFLLDGFDQSMMGGMLRSEMEDGYVHQAPANSLGRVELQLSYRLASRQAKDDFETWRRHTLANGALHFDWPDPQDWTGATLRRARIVKGEVRYKPLTKRLDDWQVSFTLEYWA